MFSLGANRPEILADETRSFLCCWGRAATNFWFLCIYLHSPIQAKPHSVHSHPLTSRRPTRWVRGAFRRVLLNPMLAAQPAAVVAVHDGFLIACRVQVLLGLALQVLLGPVLTFTMACQSAITNRPKSARARSRGA
jgi:hypothetical protein